MDDPNSKILAKIIVIDDEPALRRLLTSALASPDFSVSVFPNASEGTRAIAITSPDLVILDLGLPDRDGIECIKEIREWSQVPIIVVSARGEEQSKIAALDAGANDYVTKPFSVAELLARVRVAIRVRANSQLPKQTEYKIDQIIVDIPAHQVSKNGKPIHLTPTEFRLLTVLFNNQGKVLTHKHLLTEVWGPKYIEQNHYVRVAMKNLRHKLEEDPARPNFLLTESGVGYRLRM